MNQCMPMMPMCPMMIVDAATGNTVGYYSGDGVQYPHNMQMGDETPRANQWVWTGQAPAMLCDEQNSNMPMSPQMPDRSPDSSPSHKDAQGAGMFYAPQMPMNAPFSPMGGMEYGAPMLLPPMPQILEPSAQSKMPEQEGPADST